MGEICGMKNMHNEILMRKDVEGMTRKGMPKRRWMDSIHVDSRMDEQSVQELAQECPVFTM